MSQGDAHPSEPQRGNSGGEQQTFKSKRLATQFFMANAPPGKLLEVMENCELLVDPAAVSDRFMQETLEQAAEDRHQIVCLSSPGAAPYEALLCSAASFGKSQYLHPPTKSLLSVAARASDLVVTSSVPAPPEAFPPELEQHRVSLEKELESYLQQRRCGHGLLRSRAAPETHRGASVYSHERRDKTPAPQLTAVMSSLTESKSSSWSCSWSSEWRVYFSLSESSSPAYIEGEMEVRAFLYEDSSVQASFTRSFRLPDENLSASSSAEEGKTIPSETRDDPIISGARKSGRDREGKARCSSISLGLSGTLVESPEKFARQVMETIRDNEEVVLQEIDEFFKERALKTARGLRRVLPVYAKAFDWKQQSIQLQPHQLSVE